MDMQWILVSSQTLCHKPFGLGHSASLQSTSLLIQPIHQQLVYEDLRGDKNWKPYWRPVQYPLLSSHLLSQSFHCRYLSLVKNNFLWVNPYWLFLMTFLSFICLEMLVPRISFVTLPGMEADQPVVAQVLPTPGPCFPALELVFWSLLIIDAACFVACIFLFGLLSVSFHQGGFRWVFPCITLLYCHFSAQEVEKVWD